MKKLNLDKAITACLEKKVAKLNELFKELLFEAHKCYLGSDRLISMNDIYKYLFEDN